VPSGIRITALATNGALCALFVALALFGLGQGRLGLMLFFALVAGTCGFILYVIHKAATLLSEEEWLRAELRKAELRQQLAALQATARPPAPEQGLRP
jgi:hypothetical protein